MQNYTIGLYEKSMPNDLTVRQKLEYAKKANYEYLELSIDASEDKINRVYMSKEERLELVKDMYEVGVRIDSMCVSALTKYALGDLDEAVSNRGKDIIVNAIQLAYDLGTRIIMIPGYDIYFGESNEKTTEKFVQNLREVVEVAASYGVVLAFETMENEFMNTTKKAMEYVTLIDSPYLSVYPDSGNVTNAMKVYGQEITEDFECGRGRVVAVHLKETVPGKFREIPYGTGHVDFESVINKSLEIGVRKFVTEFWDIGKENWFDDLLLANKMMRELIEKGIHRC